ncbi:MAG: translation initiation factor IF-2 [Clostridiaceae bacterium]|jgi:translation initiation factor IF-2|nr:translation initiation factor IF-2 [Clostridiaceae bacterium]
MAKREEADSGLRAGFITEEEAIRQRREQEVRAAFQAPLTPPSTPEAEQDKKDIATEPSPEVFLKAIPGSESSTIEIQGISGKAIPGVIKLVKKPKKARPEVKEEKVKAPDEGDRAATVAPVSKQEEKVKEVEVSSDKMPVEPTRPAVATAPLPKDEKPRVSIPEKEVSKVAVDQDLPRKSAPETTPVTPDSTATPADRKPVSKEKTAPVATDVPDKAAKKAVETAPSKVTRREKETIDTTKVTTAPKASKQAPVSEPRKPAPAPRVTTPAARQDVASKPAPRTEKPRRRMSIAEKSMPITERITKPEKKILRPDPRRAVAREGDKEGAKPIRPQRGSYVGRDRNIPVSEQRSTTRRPVEPRTDRGAAPRPSSGTQRDQQRTRQDRYARPSRPAPFAPPPAPFKDGDEEAISQKTRSRRSQRSTRERERTEKRRDIQNRREQQEMIDRDANLRRSRRKDSADKPRRQPAPLSKVVLPEYLTVKEFAEAIKKTTADVIMKLMQLGVMATINQDIDYDTASIVASEFGITSEKYVEVTAEDILFDDSEDREEDLVPRPPVVVVMGHVDHGKTTILDYFRKSSMTEDEAGGITQHIGAYMVPVQDRVITFLDTPGHEAFTTLRARGAQVTDIAVLVVAADDGVMPQTVEAINHARAANTEIIVAINKIDRPEADIDRVKRELVNYELMDSSWGGSTTIVPVSAKFGTNMDELLDMIILTADVLELKANPSRQAKGTVIEASLDQARGPVATVLIQRGTLRTGDAVVVGNTSGHIRAMVDDHGKEIKEAGPSVPVEITGIADVPEGGDILYQVKSERIARDLVAKRKEEERELSLRKSSRMSLDSLFSHTAKEEKIDLNLIVKGDAQGSVEAIQRSMEELSNDKITVHVIHGAVGAITETDVRLAEVADAIIIGFNVRPTSSANLIASAAKVDIRTYRVIYEAIDEVRDAMRGMLKPKITEVVVGKLQVREVFRVSNVGTVAGCYVESGRVNRRDNVRLIRDGVVIFETTVASLRRFKDDVREVASGYECGLGLENYNDIKVGDEIEAYILEEEHDTTK